MCKRSELKEAESLDKKLLTLGTTTYLEWMDISGPQHQRSGAKADAWGDEWGGNRSRVKQIWMIADFPQLHQNVDDTHKMACSQCLLSSRERGKINQGHSDSYLDSNPEYQSQPSVLPYVVCAMKSSQRQRWRLESRHRITCSYFLGICFSTSTLTRRSKKGRRT